MGDDEHVDEGHAEATEEALDQEHVRPSLGRGVGGVAVELALPNRSQVRFGDGGPKLVAPAGQEIANAVVTEHHQTAMLAGAGVHQGLLPTTDAGA